jgi:hypothetical protein
MFHDTKVHRIFHGLLIVAVVLATLGSGLSVQPVYAAADLSVEIIAAPNLIVDSNVLSPSTQQPIVATVIGKFCNTSTAGETLTNVVGRIGNGTTAGTYPVRTNPLIGGLQYSGNYSFIHLGNVTDATRYIGTLNAGECISQYWSFTYPKYATKQGGPVNGIASWGESVKPVDDLSLQLTIWGTADGALSGSKTHTMTMRNEISAMANKIEPNGNPGGRWFNTDTSTINPGETVTTNGILYRLGNINQGFDNDGNGVPDYNAWVQPFGDPAYDPNCFRLIETTGVVTVTTTSGDVIIPFKDNLYFTDLPQNNTNAVGLVYYKFLALGGACTIPITPYQEVASGSDNEKFNGDYGAGPAPVGSYQPQVTLSKSAPGTIAEATTFTYNIPFTNTSATSTAGLTISSGGVDMPLVIQDTVPTGLQYVCGSAVTQTTLAAPNTATIYYSTDSGATWNTNQPASCPGTNPTSTGPNNLIMLRWKLNNPLPKSTQAGSSGNTAGFQAVVPTGYINGGGNPFIENCAEGKFGTSSPAFGKSCAVTIVSGSGQIGNRVWRDDNANGLQDAGETTQINNVGLTLFWDRNGNGVLDEIDVQLATQNSGSTTDLDETNTNYNYTGLPDGNYLVKIDKTDSDIDTVALGYALTTPDVVAVTLSSTNRNYNAADFGFGPALRIDKKLLSLDPAYVGEPVVYTIDLFNQLPGDGTANGFCQYKIWASTANQSAGVPPGGSGAQKQWLNTGAGIGVPDGLYMSTDMADANELVGLANFNSLDRGGNITRVELVTYFREGANFVTNSQLNMRIWDGVANAQVGTTIQYLDTNLTGAGGTTYVLRNNIDGVRGIGIGATNWNWSQFTNNKTGLQIEANKGSGSDGGEAEVDAAAFIVTTDKICAGADSTIATLPLTDTYDASRLTLLSTEPPYASATAVGSTGMITWPNLGPLYAGGTKTVTVTFEAKATTSTVTANTAGVTNAKYGNGRSVNNAFDTASVNIRTSGSIAGVVWGDNETTGGTGGWYSATGYSTNDTRIPGVKLNLYACYRISTGLMITLADVDGNDNCNSGGNGGEWRLVASTWTSSSGAYLFDGLRDGYYNVKVETASLPPGFSTCVAEALAAGNGAGSTTCDSQWNSDTADLNTFNSIDNLVSSDNITSVSFGYQEPDANQAAVLGYVWHDLNNNGVWDWTDANNNDVWDNGEGEEPIPGVTVYLCSDPGDNPCTDANDDYTPVTTNANGRYAFGNVAAGTNFRVGVNSSQLTGMTQSGDPDQPNVQCSACDHQTTAVFTVVNDAVVSVNNSGARLNFGYTSGLNIGDTVYIDWDGNGVQGDGSSGNGTEGEPGISGVNVYLYRDLDGDGVLDTGEPLIATLTTDSSGNYTFTNLTPNPVTANDYIVVVGFATLPAGYTQTGDPDIVGPCSGSGCDGQDPVNLTSNYADADFGYRPRGFGSIGDYVWIDTNGDSVQNPTESGQPNVTLNLYHDDDGDGVIDTGEDALVGTATTVGYAVIDGYLDISGNGTIGAEDNLSSLFGLRVVAGAFDINGDGLITTADDGTFGPYTVVDGRLDRNADGSASAVDDGSLKGFYLFSGLPAGEYIVQVAPAELTTGGDLAGYIMTTDGSGYNTTQASREVTLTSGQKFLDADFGFAPTAVGDFIWQDNDGDGLADAGEPGINGVVMELYRDVNNNGLYDAGTDTLYGTTTTANNSLGVPGYYLFSGMPEDNYIVRVNPSNFTSGVLQNYTLTADPDVYNNINPSSVSCLTTGAQGCDNLKPYDRYASSSANDENPAIRGGSVELTADFGYQPLGVIGDSVWIDSNGNGARDPDELGLKRITVQLCTDSSCGTIVRTTETDENGEYSFGGVPNGTYSIRVLSGTINDPDWPSNSLSSTYNFGGTVDSITNLIVVSSGHVSSVEGTSCSGCDLKIDFGYRFSGTNAINGTVWYDGDSNQSIGGTETIRYGNVPVYLWNCGADGICGGVNSADDVLVGSTLSASNGYYSFDNLANGTYRVIANTGAASLTGLKNTTPTSYNGIVLSGSTTETRNFGFNANMDLGDLPSAYNDTLLADNGARHLIPTSGAIYLGSSTPGISSEGDGTESATADADTYDDGVVRTPGVNWQVGASGASINIITSSSCTLVNPCYLSAWINWNSLGTGSDSDFNDAGERIFLDYPIYGSRTITFAVPSGVTFSNTFNARFRLYRSSTSGLAQPTGLATNGEVEDYQWNFGPTAVTLNSMTARAEASDLLTLPIFIVMGVGAVLLIVWAKRHRVA